MPDFRNALSHELAELRARALYRECRARVAGPSADLPLEFGSNDYLGLSRHPQVIQAAANALLAHGAGSTGSRLTSGTLVLHQELERELASFKDTEAAIFFSSGYLAALGVIPALVGRKDLILSDELNHACLIDGCRLSRATVRIFRHADPEHVLALLEDREQFRRVLVITDGVFSMDGDLAPLPELADLCQRNDAWLMVDDAHGTGVLGENGSGTVRHFGLEGRVHVQMGTASKALGVEGGFVAGSRELVDLLHNRARSFIFSTAPTPATVAGTRAALQVLKVQPDLVGKLAQNTERLRAGLREQGLNVPAGITPIVPVIIGEAQQAMRISRSLEAGGVRIPAIRSPTVPEGTARLRVTVSAIHTFEQIDRAIKGIAEAMRSG